MDTWKLYIVVLLPFTFCTSRKADVMWKPLVKTIGQDLDVTPICSNDTLNYIILLTCKIKVGMNQSEECRLLYRHMHGFEQGCDSRFTLVTINQTVFLHLENLTSEDSGIHRCECVRPEGTDHVQLNITVEENEDAVNSTETPPPDCVTQVIVTGVALFMIIPGVMLVIIYRKVCHRKRELPITQPTTQIEDIEPYNTFTQRENELYLTSVTHSWSTTNN